MSKAQERFPSTVYLIDSRKQDPKPFIASVSVFDVNEWFEKLTVKVGQNKYKKFSLTDYHKLFFPTAEEAQAFVDRLPEIGQKVYFVCRDKNIVTEDVVKQYSIPYVHFESGKAVCLTAFEKMFFLEKEQAMKVLNK